MTSAQSGAPDGLGSMLRFCVVGLINTCAGLAIIYLLKWFFGIADVAANAGGYAVGMLVSFTLNRRWTFRHTGAPLYAAMYFVPIFGFAYSVNLGIVLGSIRELGIDGYVAQALGMPFYTAVFYLGSRYVAFR
jgi:putative flippase GtrA